MNISLTRFIRKRFVGMELASFRPYRSLFEGRSGLEIGGPSKLFGSKDVLPVYGLAARVDGVNFATNTVWEGQLTEGLNYRYAKRKVGRQFIREATSIHGIADGAYDFVLSCHNLEHTADPLKAVAEWKRVLTPRGILLLVLPDKRFTFDHLRPTTTFSHLLEDCRCGVGEDDLTHLDEILALHDGSKDAGYGDATSFAARSRANVDNRCLHHHVFDQALLRQVFEHTGIETISASIECPGHVIALGRLR